MSTLHYLYDPFCAWCYGAAPMIDAARGVAGLAIQPHGVGMLSGDKARFMGADWRDFVRPHEARVTQLTGQPFGAAYTDGVQEREDVRLDSSVPIVAMLVAEELDGRGVELLERLHSAYFQEGREVADPQVAIELAAEIGLDRQAFAERFAAFTGDELKAHLRDSQAWLQRLQARGFPAFALEHDGRLEVLQVGHYLSHPERFKEKLQSLLA